MAKKRKTRQEKIILQLKRELTQLRSQEKITTIKSRPRQEAISKAKPKPALKASPPRKEDTTIFFYSPHLVKKDLLKSLALAGIVVSLEIMLYLRLR